MNSFEPHELGRRLCVVSPHLDDAALSLGATIAGAARRGVDVRVLTVFAGDVRSRAAATSHDRACGFHSAAEAAARRRDEDREALSILGAEPEWLPFVDSQDEGAAEPSVRAAVAERLADADTILFPGFPLSNQDHAWLARLLVSLEPAGARGLYIEQPYASWLGLSRDGSSLTTWRAALRPGTPAALASTVSQPLLWRRPRITVGDWRRKRDAVVRYRSQLPRLRRRPLLRIALYEAMRGGEGVAWVDR